jgi:hypothetical protein
MPRTTVLDGSEFAGKTKSFTVLQGGGNWPTCRGCGSTLYPQRRESSKVHTIGGSSLNVWRLAREGKGQVVEDWAEPDAQQLADAGWLERRTVDANGDTCWFWTREAEGALDVKPRRVGKTDRSSAHELIGAEETDGPWAHKVDSRPRPGTTTGGGAGFPDATSAVKSLGFPVPPPTRVVRPTHRKPTTPVSPG